MMDVSVIMKFVKERPHSCNRRDKLALPKKMRRLWERTSCKELFRKKGGVARRRNESELENNGGALGAFIHCRRPCGDVGFWGSDDLCPAFGSVRSCGCMSQHVQMRVLGVSSGIRDQSISVVMALAPADVSRVGLEFSSMARRSRSGRCSSVSIFEPCR